MKKIFIILIFVFFSSYLVTAMDIPQVIFSFVNISIAGNCTGVTYSLNGEGLSATDSFSSNLIINSTGNSTASCTGNSSYYKGSIPMTFARIFYQNNTDVAVLLNSLATNNNITGKWQSCVELNRQMDTNLTACLMDRGYKSNFTECQNSLDSYVQVTKSKDTTISTLTTENSQLKSHRMMLGAIAILLGFMCYSYWKKTEPKTVKSPLSSLPSAGKIY
jgi:hypothetical protein